VRLMNRYILSISKRGLNHRLAIILILAIPTQAQQPAQDLRLRGWGIFATQEKAAEIPAPRPERNLPDANGPLDTAGRQQSAAAPAGVLTLEEAVRLALLQASTFQQARLNEMIAAEDVRQSRSAFFPQINTTPSQFVYTSPTLGHSVVGQPSTPSFIANNATKEYYGVVGASGEVDVSGRLRATLRRNAALLEAAKAGTEVARRALIQGVDEAYYGFALAAARRRSAELNLAAADEFQRITDMLFNGGEVAQVDLGRARLQTFTRRDEMSQALTAEAAAADSLRILVGYDFTNAISVTELATLSPAKSEIDQFTADMIERRPELAQYDAQVKAAEQDARAARAARRPSLTYQILAGFDTDSLNGTALHDHTGSAVTLNINIPIFDWGISKSREKQARLRAETLESQRTVALKSFAQQFYAARMQALAAVDRAQNLRTAVVEAERNVQTSIARYRAGEAPILEVTDAQTTLAAQRTALSQALYDYQAARARLLLVSGR
jgi:outer membrane protein